MAGQRRDRHQRRDRQGAFTSTPVAYLITFTTYGTWMHGDARSSVDADHRVYGTPYAKPNVRRERVERAKLKHPSVVLSDVQRAIVDQAVRGVCDHREWTLYALNVRTNHVHVVVSAPAPPERLMNSLKSWSTRRMVEAGVWSAGTKAWTRHGSTRYVWTREQLLAACRYVAEAQGDDL